MKAKMFACYTLADEISKILPPGIELDLLPYALHRTPQCECQRVVYIDTGIGDYKYSEYAREVADYLKVSYEERKGSLTFLQKLFRGEWDKEFVVTAPGRLVMQKYFL